MRRLCLNERGTFLLYKTTSKHGGAIKELTICRALDALGKSAPSLNYLDIACKRKGNKGAAESSIVAVSIMKQRRSDGRNRLVSKPAVNNLREVQTLIAYRRKKRNAQTAALTITRLSRIRDIQNLFTSEESNSWISA